MNLASIPQKMVSLKIRVEITEHTDKLLVKRSPLELEKHMRNKKMLGFPVTLSVI